MRFPVKPVPIRSWKRTDAKGASTRVYLGSTYAPNIIGRAQITPNDSGATLQQWGIELQEPFLMVVGDKDFSDSLQVGDLIQHNVPGGQFYRVMAPMRGFWLGFGADHGSTILERIDFTG